MPHRSKPGVNWDDIRQRYEAGESANGIANSGVGVSKQAILGRIKRHGWSRNETERDFNERQRRWQSEATPPVTYGVNGASLKAYHGKDTPEARGKVLAALEMGAPYDIAAKAAGISHVTLADWRKKDVAFAEQCDMARAQKAVDHIGVINHAGLVNKDWKASEAFLRRHEATKADWAEQGKAGGPTINVMLQVARGSATAMHSVTIDAQDMSDAPMVENGND